MYTGKDRQDGDKGRVEVDVERGFSRGYGYMLGSMGFILYLYIRIVQYSYVY